METELICGRNAVIELLKTDRAVDTVYISSEDGEKLSYIAAMAREKKIVVKNVPASKLTKMCGRERHQGVAAWAAPTEYVDIDEILGIARSKNEDPFVIIADGIEDPHNLGAIIRTAECAGAHGVVIPKRRAASLTQTVALSAAGAIENMPVVQVTNLARTIEELQAKGVWVGAADMDGETYYEANLTGPIAIVIGNEGKGVGRLVKEKCDFVLSIPMYGKINSLNASNAAAVLMYGIRRARN